MSGARPVADNYYGGPGHTVGTPYSPIYVTPKVPSPSRLGVTTATTGSNPKDHTGGPYKHTFTINTRPSTGRPVTVGTFLPVGPRLKDETTLVRP